MSAAPLRIQGMRLKLQPYNFKLVHVSGKKIGLADCLSRLPQQVTAKDHVIDEELMVCKVDTLAYGWHDRVEEATRMDEDLQTLRRVIFSGWPATRQEIPAAVTPYWDARDEFEYLQWNSVQRRTNSDTIQHATRDAKNTPHFTCWCYENKTTRP